MNIAYINVAYQDGIFVFNRAKIPKFKNASLEEIIFDDTTNFDSIVQAIDFCMFDAYMLPISYELFDFDCQVAKLIREYSPEAKIYFLLKGKFSKGMFNIELEGHDIICISENDSSIGTPRTGMDFAAFSKMFAPSSEDPYYFLTMQNGYTAFVTGIYPENIDNEQAKHIYISSQYDTAEWDFKKLCDLNAAVFTKGDNAVRKFGVESYLHHHQLADGQILFDGGRAILKSEILPYSEYLEDREKLHEQKECKRFLSVTTMDDLLAFERDLDDFVLNNRICSWNSSLVDECRWVNGCTLKNLCRYSVTDSNEIQPCITSASTIAQVNDSHYTKLISAGEKYDQTLIERNCEKCTKRQFCSKCAMLPQNIPSKEFCRLMDRYMLIVEYVYKRDMLGALKQHSNLFSHTEDIRISCCTNPIVFPREYIAIKDSKVELAKFGLLFGVGNQYIVFCYKNKELAEIDIRLAFIMEGYCSAVCEEDISEAYRVRFSVSENDAKEMVSRGLNFLKEAAIVY